MAQMQPAQSGIEKEATAEVLECHTYCGGLNVALPRGATRRGGEVYSLAKWQGIRVCVCLPWPAYLFNLDFFLPKRGADALDVLHFSLAHGDLFLDHRLFFLLHRNTNLVPLPHIRRRDRAARTG